LELEKRIMGYIHGGRSEGRGARQHGEKDDVAVGPGHNGVGWMNPSLLRSSLSLPTNTDPHTGGGVIGSSKSRPPPPSNGRIAEGENVNIDVTAPGGLMALALMYLNSNNTLVASRLPLPETHYALDEIRPDFLFLRVLARHLVLFGSIPDASTEGVITHSIPELFSKYLLSIRWYMPKYSEKAAKVTSGKRKEKVSADESRMDESDREDEDDEPMDNLDEEDSPELEEDFDGFTAPPGLPSASMHPSSSTDPVAPSSSSQPTPEETNLSDVDFATLRQSYLHSLAATCFALGVKYAGTANRKVHHILLRVLKAFRSVARKKSGAGGGDFHIPGLCPSAQLHRTDRPTLDSVTLSVASALAMVLAGTGHLGTLRLFRGMMRQRPDKNTPAGWHQRLSMCLGLLFLGAGAGGRSLDTNLDSFSAEGMSRIAYLLISFYPCVTSSLEENRYYGSIYRHLYVLATVDRSVRTIDVASGVETNVPLEIVVDESSSASSSGHSTQEQSLVPSQLPKLRRLKFITPALLPHFSSIVRLKLVSPRFHSLDIQVRSSSGTSDFWDESMLHSLPVLRKLGFESYAVDPRGVRSVSNRAFPGVGLLGSVEAGSVDGVMTRNDFLRSLSTDGRLSNFVRLFIHSSTGSALASSLRGPQEFLSEYLSKVVYECVTDETFFPLIPLYLQLFPLAGASGQQEEKRIEACLSDTNMVWTIVMIRGYYDSISHTSPHQPTAAKSTSKRNTASHQRGRILNASTPFSELPLAEGSANLDFSDPDPDRSADVGRAQSKPLLARPFVDAILHRCESFFISNVDLQTSFTRYIRSCTMDVEDGAAPTLSLGQGHGGQGVHPLLVSSTGSREQTRRSPASCSLLAFVVAVLAVQGSLLIYWQIPAPHSLRSGLQMLRSQRVPTIPALASAQRLLLAGLLWPSLSPAAIRAILRALEAPVLQ
jgi:hypothetical protein